jgi:reactive intermediate/imine deaminase
MSELELINPPGTEAIYESFKFSQAVVAGGRVDVAGQVGLGPDMKVPGEIDAQARYAFENLKTVLEAAGSSLAEVTQLTVYLTDISDSPAVNDVFAEFFPERYPARTVVQVVAQASAVVGR